MERRRVWLDCDPGHDDAFAIVLALFNSRIELVGISTTAGNQTLEKTTLNAIRMLRLCRHGNGEAHSRIPVVRGVDRPLIAKPKQCPEIHGSSGLDLPPEYAAQGAQFVELCVSAPAQPESGILLVRNKLMEEKAPIDLVATGCLTNVALLIATFPEVDGDVSAALCVCFFLKTRCQVKSKIRQIVFLGGAVGFPAGNVVEQTKNGVPDGF